MARRKSREITIGAGRAAIYRDAEQGEFVVQFYKDGEYLQDADYFTDDMLDAVGTANHALRVMDASAKVRAAA